jgi:hypothetical protein
LQLGKVNKSAKVFINVKIVGTLWSIPYEARIGRYLKTGQNTIMIEVANLAIRKVHDTTLFSCIKYLVGTASLKEM